MSRSGLIDSIRRLKAERNAVFLVHNYQRPEIQELADYLGDSLELARHATKLSHPVIVFCGVHFMAESAALLAPEKTILLPVLEAGCPLAECATPEMVRVARKRYPDAVFVAYINTSAAVKAEVDVICTSANALTILKHHADRRIVYLPDKNLAAYAARELRLDIIQWPGQCYVHDKLISLDQVMAVKKQHPDAFVMAHPEAPIEVLDAADAVVGTGGMLKLARESAHTSFIVVTETGLIDRMRREIKGKTFIGIDSAVCSQMKLTTLQSVHDALAYMQYKITVTPAIALRARSALERMLELSS